MKAFPNDTLGKGVCLVPETIVDNELIRLLNQMTIRNYTISGDDRGAHVHLELHTKKEAPIKMDWATPDAISLSAALYDLTRHAGMRSWNALEDNERFVLLERSQCLIPILRKILK